MLSDAIGRIEAQEIEKLALLGSIDRHLSIIALMLTVQANPGLEDLKLAVGRMDLLGGLVK